MLQIKTKPIPSLQDITDHPILLEVVDDIPKNYHLQLAAIMSDGLMIRYINDPDENLRMIAIKNDAFAITYLKNPSQEECLEACQKNGEALDYIDEDIITQAMIFCAIKSKPSIILDMIPDITEQMIEFAVNYQPSLISKFDEPDEPSERVMLTAIQRDGLLIRHLYGLNIPQRIKDEAVKQNPMADLYIEN